MFGKAVSFGSLNIDITHRVPHIVRPGETLTSTERSTNPGGKGLNQAVAMARAGLATAMAGRVGPDGHSLLDFLAGVGIDVSDVTVAGEPSGYAMIQVDDQGANCILVHPGSNRLLTPNQISRTLARYGDDDLLLAQNETNHVDLIIATAQARGMSVAWNPSPIDANLAGVDMELVDFLFVNEIEAAALTGLGDPQAALDELTGRHPNLQVIMTMGDKGASFGQGASRHFCAASAVPVVDTTGAGDTMTGFFLAAVGRGQSPETALATGTRAAGITVSRSGAAQSIPSWDEVCA